MKHAYVRNNTIIEIIPEAATPIEKWYNSEFASHCQEVSDEVEPNWIWGIEEQKWMPPNSGVAHNFVEVIQKTLQKM